MFTLIGLVIVLGGVIGGYLFENGPLQVLIQPAELVIIFGAAVGSLLVAAPGKAFGQVAKAIAGSFASSSPTKADYLDLLKLQYEVYQFLRKNGAVALDEHVQEVEKSAIFSKYPGLAPRLDSTLKQSPSARTTLTGIPEGIFATTGYLARGPWRRSTFFIVL